MTPKLKLLLEQMAVLDEVVLQPRPNVHMSIGTLIKIIQKQAEALEFYAKPGNWQIYHHQLSGMHDEDTLIKDDGGEKAKQAEKEIEKLCEEGL